MKKEILDDFMKKNKDARGSPNFYLGASMMLDFLLDEQRAEICPYTVCQMPVLSVEELDALNEAIKSMSNYPSGWEKFKPFKDRVKIVHGLKSIRENFKERK